LEGITLLAYLRKMKPYLSYKVDTVSLIKAIRHWRNGEAWKKGYFMIGVTKRGTNLSACELEKWQKKW